MTVHVKLFAAAKEHAGSDEVTIDVPNGATIADVCKALRTTVPALDNIIPHALWAVDTQYAADSTPVTATSEIALIPPVSGG